MIACALRDGRSVWIECRQEETRDQQTLNLWFQIMLYFMHLPTVIFLLFSLCAVCKITVTLALFEQYDSQYTQTTQNKCPVSYSVYFLFNYIFIKYLFICEKYFVI